MIPSVIPDTTELYKIPVLDAGGWTELLVRCRRGQVRIILPEVVLRESARHYADALRSDVERAKRTFAGMRKLGHPGIPDFDGATLNVADNVDFYLDGIRARLEEYGAEIAPLPDVSQEAILARDLAVKKPFAPSGKGYRDTLIWESVLAHLEDKNSDSDVYFVSTNSGDWSDKGSADLAESLKEELGEYVGGDRVRLIATGAEVLNNLRSYFQGLDENDDLTELLLGPSLSELLEGALLGELERLQGEHVEDLSDSHRIGLIPFDEIVPGIVSDATLEAIFPSEQTLEYSVYERYDGDTLGLSATLDTEIEFEGFIAKSDFYITDEIFDVLDPDWNDHVMEVGFTRRVRLSFAVLTVGQSVESIELESAEHLPSEPNS